MSGNNTFFNNHFFVVIVALDLQHFTRIDYKTTITTILSTLRRAYYSYPPMYYPISIYFTCSKVWGIYCFFVVNAVMY